MEADPAVIAQLHNQLVPDLENSDDSGSDEEEDACAGWEAVSVVYTFIMNPVVSYNQWVPYMYVGTKYRLPGDDGTYSWCDGYSAIL